MKIKLIYIGWIQYFPEGGNCNHYGPSWRMGKPDQRDPIFETLENHCYQQDHFEGNEFERNAYKQKWEYGNPP